MRCCDLTSGMLRHVVTVQTQSRAADSAGGAAVVWLSIEDGVRGKLEPLSARERMQADRREHNITHRFYCRWRGTFSAAHRVLYNGRAMQIVGMINIEERSKWLELDLIEGMAT